MRLTFVVPLLLLTGCGTTVADRPGDRFWGAVRPYCGQAFRGRLAEGTEPADAAMGAQPLVMHVQSCTADEIRIPFHVGDNRSRTWVISRTPAGVRLKHDHRHEDGTPDQVTQYGGDTGAGDDDLALEFAADHHTATLIPAASTNIWTLAIDRPQVFTYALRRENSSRRFRVEFDLSKPIATPPPPW